MHDRQAIEHQIWVAAYLHALSNLGPVEAEAWAVDASRRYYKRWQIRPGQDGFDAISLSSDELTVCEDEEEEEDEVEDDEPVEDSD